MTVGLTYKEKTETLWKLTGTCGNEERVSVLLKLHWNFLHLVSAYWNFSVCFRTAETRLKLTHQVSADGKLTESSLNYTISPLRNFTGNFNSKFLCSFSSVPVLLKRYFSSSEFDQLVLSDIEFKNFQKSHLDFVSYLP